MMMESVQTQKGMADAGEHVLFPAVIVLGDNKPTISNDGIDADDNNADTHRLQ